MKWQFLTLKYTEQNVIFPFKIFFVLPGICNLPFPVKTEFVPYAPPPPNASVVSDSGIKIKCDYSILYTYYSTSVPVLISLTYMYAVVTSGTGKPLDEVDAAMLSSCSAWCKVVIRSSHLLSSLVYLNHADWTLNTEFHKLH